MLRKAVTPSPIVIVLLRRLGNEYHGAERYRLEADRKKEVHWKRWGPYLSDRQWVRLCRLCATGNSCRECVSALRQPFEKTILTTVMLGITSPTSTHVQGLIDGEKMALPVSPITTSACVWRYRYGTARIVSSKNVFLVLPVIKVIMARTSKNSTGTSTRRQHTPT
jgi:hypothetical protein